MMSLSNPAEAVLNNRDLVGIIIRCSIFNSFEHCKKVAFTNKVGCVFKKEIIITFIRHFFLGWKNSWRVHTRNHYGKMRWRGSIRLARPEVAGREHGGSCIELSKMLVENSNVLPWSSAQIMISFWGTWRKLRAVSQVCQYSCKHSEKQSLIFIIHTLSSFLTSSADYVFWQTKYPCTFHTGRQVAVNAKKKKQSMVWSCCGTKKKTRTRSLLFSEIERIRTHFFYFCSF